MQDKKLSEALSFTEEKKDTLSKKQTPTPKGQKTTTTGTSDTTKLTTTTSQKYKSERLEQEAKEFRKKKSPPVKPKPMTSRIYLAGQAMSALLTRNQGPVRREDIKREAYEWADYFLSDD